MRRLGVSPAYVVSRFGTAFTVDEFQRAMDEIHGAGFAAFQPEIFLRGELPAWADGGARRLAGHASSLGLTASQFVAHFLLENFATAGRLASTEDRDDLQRAIACARAFEDCRVFTVPVAPFRLEGAATLTAGWYHDQRQRLIAKVHAYADAVAAAGLTLALEVLPFSLVGGIDGFLRLAGELGSTPLGLNLDTGHAWATREIMPLLPARLAGRILGVHLKDNNSDHNQALAPGRGTIPWAPFLDALSASGYTGSWDLEIGCPAAEVAATYAAGRDYLLSLPLHPTPTLPS